MPGEKELKLKATLAGGQETAAGLDRVAVAEAKVTDKIKEGVPATEQAAASQERLNLSESDYVTLLNNVQRGLGEFLLVAYKASQVLGEIGTTNIDGIAIWKKVTEVIKENAGALKTLGAGGSVVASILAIVHVTRKMREEFEAATKAIEDNQQALTGLKREEAERQQALEALAARRTEGGYATTDQARAAAQQAERIGAAQPQISPEAIAQAVALGGERTTEELTRIAQALAMGKLQLEPGMQPAEREARIDIALERFGEQITRELDRNAAKQQEALAAAIQQARAQEGGNIGDLVKLLERYLPAGMDAEKLARIAQEAGTAEALERTRARGRQRRGGDVGAGLSDAEFAALAAAMRSMEAAGGGGAKGVLTDAQRLQSLDDRIRQLLEAIERREAERDPTRAGYPADIVLTQQIIALEARIRFLEKEKAQIINNNQHARFVQTDAGATKRATKNGENDRELRGVG